MRRSNVADHLKAYRFSWRASILCRKCAGWLCRDLVAVCKFRDICFHHLSKRTNNETVGTIASLRLHYFAGIHWLWREGRPKCRCETGSSRTRERGRHRWLRRSNGRRQEIARVMCTLAFCSLLSGFRSLHVSRLTSGSTYRGESSMTTRLFSFTSLRSQPVSGASREPLQTSALRGSSYGFGAGFGRKPDEVVDGAVDGDGLGDFGW